MQAYQVSGKAPPRSEPVRHGGGSLLLLPHLPGMCNASTARLLLLSTPEYHFESTMCAWAPLPVWEHAKKRKRVLCVSNEKLPGKLGSHTTANLRRDVAGLELLSGSPVAPELKSTRTPLLSSGLLETDVVRLDARFIMHLCCRSCQVEPANLVSAISSRCPQS